MSPEQWLGRPEPAVSTETRSVASEAKIRIGTSGWSYRHWRGPFYPPDVPQREWLARYARRFRTVEINTSFYRLPREETLAAWKDAVPGDFLFAAKASRFVTHRKKLKDPADTVPPFLDRMEMLAEKMGPILFQLPPGWGFDPGRLESFLAALRAGRRYAFELRDPAWMNERAFDILARHGAAFCIYELGGRLSPKEVTADFVYVRLHGPGGPYRGSYGVGTLAGWAGAFSSWAAGGRDVFCYFDNDEKGYAAENAHRLDEMIRGG